VKLSLKREIGIPWIDQTKKFQNVSDAIKIKKTQEQNVKQ
jgi:hypothetical protein